MNKTLIINNLEFAQKQLKWADNATVFDLKRLTENLGVNEESAKKALIYFELSGRGQQLRYPSLHLGIKTSLPAICQRCMDNLSIDVDLKFDYLISQVALDEEAENDEIDWLEEQSEMNLLELIEDELLLAMPIAPLHSNNCVKASMQSGDKPNPFAILKGKY